MDTAPSPKTWQHSCSARVFRTHTNQLPGNTLTTSRLLLIINYQISSPESYKKRIGERLMLSDKAPLSTSFQQRKLWTKNAQNVAKLTTQHNNIGQEEKIRTKKAQDKRSPKSQIRLEKRKGQNERAKKRHKRVPIFYLYQK